MIDFTNVFRLLDLDRLPEGQCGEMVRRVAARPMPVQSKLWETWIILRAVLLDFAQGGPELNVKH